mmetsp:Transcript_38177/g.50296  ORF Transcript_38177/g.50296 Transcript_38177/m.50296 type:complete len:659 (-) Transcript_38177:43-2019(-)
MNFGEASRELDRIEQRLDRMQSDGKNIPPRTPTFNTSNVHPGVSSPRRTATNWTIDRSGDDANVTNMSHGSLSPTRLRLHRTGSVDIETTGEVGLNSSGGPLASGLNAMRASYSGGGFSGYGASGQASRVGHTPATGIAASRGLGLGSRPPIASTIKPTSASKIEEELREIKDAMKKLDTSKSVVTPSPQPAQQNLLSTPMMNSMMNTSTNTSKAVLSALRALQDKIRRLEGERAKAIDECSRLQERLQQVEVESNHLRQVDAISAQEKASAARLAYERLMAEKNQVDVRLAKAEEQKKALARDADAQRDRAHQAEVGHRTAESQVVSLETRVAELEAEVRDFQRREKDLHGSMNRTQSQLDREISSLRRQLQKQREELNSQLAMNQELQTSRQKMDRFLEGVLAINQALVTKAAAPAPKKKKKKGAKGKAGMKKGPTIRSRRSSMNQNNSNVKDELALANRSSVPFLPTPNKNSFNIIAAVSDALAKARQKDPGQVLEELYERVGYKALTGDESLSFQPTGLDVEIPKPEMGNTFLETPGSSGENTNRRSSLANVAEDLEAELAGLNDRYQELLMRTSKPNDMEDAASETDALEMANLIEAIQQRSSQLETLKKALQPKPPKQILFSPEAQKKKIAALRVLRDFRDSREYSRDLSTS